MNCKSSNCFNLKLSEYTRPTKLRQKPKQSKYKTKWKQNLKAPSKIKWIQKQLKTMICKSFNCSNLKLSECKSPSKVKHQSKEVWKQFKTNGEFSFHFPTIMDSCLLDSWKSISRISVLMESNATRPCSLNSWKQVVYSFPRDVHDPEDSAPFRSNSFRWNPTVCKSNWRADDLKLNTSL